MPRQKELSRGRRGTTGRNGEQTVLSGPSSISENSFNCLSFPRVKGSLHLLIPLRPGDWLVVGTWLMFIGLTEETLREAPSSGNVNSGLPAVCSSRPPPHTDLASCLVPS